ncbi:uncharacterized protein LOC121382228 [Gigantopelta aegis]|uniref:uncharacterized protein LOC121382228 n=1 Tax=Gigantopelta aegis TaxID=1735272 RepID=UPI001B88B5AE|nr:uncharacterized protein LOC121382228 [Gigantopelta aegis]
MSADPQTVVCSMTECEKVQNLLRSYTHILTKESEKVISRITDIRGDVEDTLASRKTLTGDIRLWERNMIAAVHAEAERCINDLNVQADLQLTKLRDLEEQLQTLLMTLNEVCLKLNILTIQTFTENNMEHTVRSIRNNIKMELEKLCFPDQFNATKLCLVPNITPGQSLVNIRKCPLLLDENKQNIFHPVSIEKTISLGKTIKSRVSGDTFYPMIGDIAVVPPDNVIVVCDWKNQCLKSFYKSYNSRLAMSFKSPCLSSELQAEVDCVPWHLAAISDNTVAVTTNHHQILLVDVWPSLALKSRIPVNQFYHGIRLVNESSLAVSYNKNSNIVVDIVSHEGRVVHTINTGVVGDVWNTCMDVSSDEDVLIGSRSCGVSCFSQQNVVKWVFPGPNGRNLKPVSVCSIGADRFIAVDRSGRVVCINSVSAETTVLVSKLSGVIEPTCVYVTSSLLCLAEWRSGKIKLFNIDMNKK